jgi:hypothetical protein
LTYIALNDTATERKGRDDSDDGKHAAAELHLKLAEAMAKAAGPSRTIGGLIAEEQLTIASEIAMRDPVKPEV